MADAIVPQQARPVVDLAVQAGGLALAAVGVAAPCEEFAHGQRTTAD
jgi:hypothetical protein